jgi:hypothetical protein
MKTINKIDVHHHIAPKEYVEKLKQIGVTESLGVSFPKWIPETSLSFMKKVGIRTALNYFLIFRNTKFLQVRLQKDNTTHVFACIYLNTCFLNYNFRGIKFVNTGVTIHPGFNHLSQKLHNS